jgi:flagellar biosynthesis/type III secretory pathway protein FliH
MFAALLAATLFCSTPLHVWAEGSDEHGYTVTEEEKQAKEKLDAAQKEYDEAVDDAYDEGYADGHSDGYDEGVEEGLDEDDVIEAVRNALRQ